MRARTLVLTALIIAGLAVPAQAIRGDRYSGQDRVQTSVNVAQRTTVHQYRIYLARGDNSADALAAGALTDGPVVLVPSCGEVPDDVGFLVAQAGESAEVIALGGEAAICDAMLRGVADGNPTSRIAGATRFDTAARIATRAFPDGAREVYLGNAFDSPDPVAGGVLRDGPMLLVPPSGQLPPEVAAAIDQLDPQRVVALGGTVAVGQTILDQAAAGRTADRIAGASRFDTAVQISRYLWGSVPERQTSTPLPASRAYLARSDVFADALAAGSATDGPILLVPSCGELPDVVKEELGRLRVEEVVALGGFSAVCDPTLREAVATPPPPGVWFKVTVSQFFTGLHAQAQEVVAVAGAEVTYNGQTRTTDAVGEVRFDFPGGDRNGFLDWAVEGGQLLAPVASNGPGQDCETQGSNGDSLVCNLQLSSFTIGTGADYPDDDSRRPPLAYEETIRVVGRDEVEGVDVTRSTTARPDGTTGSTMFFALPPGPYDVFVTREGCKETWMHRGGIRVSGGTGFAALTRSPCQPVDD